MSKYRSSNGMLTEFRQYLAKLRKDPDYNEFNDLTIAQMFVADKFSHHASELTISQEAQLIDLFSKIPRPSEVSESRYHQMVRDAYGLAIRAEKMKAKKRSAPENRRAIEYFEKRMAEHPAEPRKSAYRLEQRVIASILGAGMIIFGAGLASANITGLSILLAGMMETRLQGAFLAIAGILVMALAFRKREN